MSRINPNWRIAVLAMAVLAFDQITKLLVLKYLGYAQEKVILDGFFKFVHWGNTGAAWSLFNQFAGSNQLLAIFALVALLVLFLTRHHFDSHTLIGQLSLGLIFGGIETLAFGYWNYWQYLDDWMRFVSLIAGFCILVFVGYRQFSGARSPSAS